MKNSHPEPHKAVYYSEVLDISSATCRVVPDLLKDLVILSDTTIRRSAADQEDLKPNCKSEKGHISLDDL